MKKTIKTTLLVLLAVGLFYILFSSFADVLKGEKGNAFLQTTEAKQISVTAQNIFTKVHGGDFIALSKYYGSNFNDQTVNNFVAATQLHFPKVPPDKVKLIGLKKTKTFSLKGQQSNTISAFLEYEFKDYSYQVAVIYATNNDKIELIEIYGSDKISNTLKNSYKVDLSQASFLQYLVLTITCIVPLFILTTLILCIKTQNLKRKWLWILFIIWGFVGFHFNWTTQTFTITPVNFYLFGAGFLKDIYSPLILSFSLPIGAIIFLKKKYFIKK